MSHYIRKDADVTGAHLFLVAKLRHIIDEFPEKRTVDGKIRIMHCIF